MATDTETPPFITIEGIDKAGKSSLIERLTDRYDDTVLTTEPNDDHWLGKNVRRAISGDEPVPPLTTFHLFVADHHYHVENVVKPALDEGQMVICDRYVDSRYVYQQEAIDGHLGGEDVLEWIRGVQETPDSTVLPDLTILIDITVEESARRQGSEDGEIFENEEFLRVVRQNYLELAEMYPERFVVIDGEQSKEAVAQEAFDAIDALI